jgi:8-oxo-dGTP diphosphatase
MSLKILRNPEKVTNEEVLSYNKREAARAVIFDAEGKVALLHVTRDKYYKLPGGGIEAGESKEDAVKRECLEEVGCYIEVGEYLGELTEYRRQIALNQTSFCYIAKVLGPKGEQHLEPGEIEEGHDLGWYTLEEALTLLRTAEPVDYEGPFIVARDIVFLTEAKKILKI